MLEQKTTQAADKEQETLERFRSSLEDAVAVGFKMMPFFGATADMVEAAQLALKNEGQLRLLLQVIMGKEGQKR